MPVVYTPRNCAAYGRLGRKGLASISWYVCQICKFLCFSQLLLNHLLRFKIGSVRKHGKNDSKQLMGRRKQSFLRREPLSLSSEKISFEERVLTCHSRGHEIDSSSEMIAALFAVENISFEQEAERKALVFCFNHKWINNSAKWNIADDNLFKMRFDDKTMTEDSFKRLYMEKKRNFIVAENPQQLHRRLSIQRGVFIVQGNISKSMMENIKSMDD